MFGNLSLLVGAVAMLADAPASASLPPAGHWTVEYKAGDCTLSRSFGGPAKPIVFGIKPTVDFTAGELVLIIPGSAGKSAKYGTGSLRLFPVDNGSTIRWAAAPLKDGQGHGVRFDAPREFWDDLPTSTEVRLQVGEGRPIRLALGPMKGAIAAAQKCGDDLMRNWGANPAAVLKPPASQTIGIFSTDDYPAEALRNQEQGRVTTLTTVNLSGKPIGCTVLKTSGHASLDEAVCRKIMRVGQFAPAGESGPDKRFVFLTVSWEAPEL